MSHLNDTGYLLHSLSSTLDRQSDELLQKSLGIGFAQFKILSAISPEQTTQKTISRELGQTEASVSRQVKLMQGQGLIEVRVQPNNRREHIVSMTAKGRRRLSEAYRLLNRFHAPVFARLSEQQRNLLHQSLQVLHIEASRRVD